MKLFMLWDMEGVSGLFAREQVWFWEPGVRGEVAEEGRRLLIANDSNYYSLPLGRMARNVGPAARTGVARGGL